MLKFEKQARAASLQQKTTSLRYRTPQNDTDDLVVTCAKDLKQEKADFLRKTLRDILNDDRNFLHVRYMQAERVEMLVPRHQAQAIFKSLIKVGQSVVNKYFIAGMQVRQDRSSEEQFQ